MAGLAGAQAQGQLRLRQLQPAAEEAADTGHGRQSLQSLQSLQSASASASVPDGVEGARVARTGCSGAGRGRRRGHDGWGQAEEREAAGVVAGGNGIGVIVQRQQHRGGRQGRRRRGAGPGWSGPAQAPGHQAGAGAVRCGAVRCGAVRCSGMRRGGVPCTATITVTNAGTPVIK